MPKLVLMCAPPGAGKTTLALKYEAEGFVRISQDDSGKAHLSLFLEALAAGKNIVVDRMNFNREQRDRYLAPAKKAGYETKIEVLHESRATCLERCIARTGHPTIKDEDNAKSALSMFFSKYERVQDNEADEVVRHWPENEKPYAVWIDIDNTLSDATHRQHHLHNDKGARWDKFFAEMDKDPINLWCETLIEGMHEKYKVVICSGRPDNYKAITEAWLNKHAVPYDALFMRSANDSRKDSIVKEQLFEFEVKTRFDLLFAVDDRKQVIDQMRSHGVVVLDCAGEKGNF